MKFKLGYFYVKIEWGECLKKEEEEKIYFEFIWILILSGVNGVFYVLKVCLF